MSIESLDKFIDNCAACVYLTHRCYKYKSCAWCTKWDKEISDMLHTCLHYQKDPSLSEVKETPRVHRKKSKSFKVPKFIVDYGF